MDLQVWCKYLCLVLFYNCAHSFVLNDLYDIFKNSNSQAPSEKNYEFVYLPVIFPVRENIVEESSYNTSEDIDYKFSAFGRSISLKLSPNNNLLSPYFKIYVQEDNDVSRVINKPTNNCHYLHRDEHSVAAFNLCQRNAVHGLIFLDNTTLEISPILPEHHQFIQSRELYDEPVTNDAQGLLHIVKRATFENILFPEIERQIVEPEETELDIEDEEHIRNVKTPANKLTLEVALFFDEKAYKIFAPYLKHDDKKIAEMLLAYINAIQALYHHPSLGRSVDLVLVRLEIMKHQPSDLPHHQGERSKLLDSFCDYQKSKNPKGDSNPEHWDMALYVSGLDFYAIENGKRSGVTMGLASVGGVCLDKYNCVIAELGTTNVFGKPYPSAGFTSVYILAHEIGHNLGMHHDSTGNRCSKEGYIMSPSRGTSGETQWSTCSAEVMNNLKHATCLNDKHSKVPAKFDHTKYQEKPGQIINAKKQCEFLLRDKDALPSPNQKLADICNNLQCKTPHRSGYYHAGPPLEGTSCGNGKWCQGGYCEKATKPKPSKVIPGGWSPWKSDKCHSHCISHSRGYQKRRRECNNPIPVNSDEGCEGFSYDTVLCKDERLCSKRVTPVEFASQKCQAFSKLLPQLDSQGAGLQAPHEEGRPWMGCAIFCRRSDSGSYYTPRIELNDLNVSPYFPDGTWCHHDQTGDYYCLQNHCLPENFKLTKTSSSILHGIGEDIPFPQNAHPSVTLPPELQNYLSLDSEGKPMQTSLKKHHIKPFHEQGWETNDYIELPPGLKSEGTEEIVM